MDKPHNKKRSSLTGCDWITIIYCVLSILLFLFDGYRWRTLSLLSCLILDLSCLFHFFRAVRRCRFYSGVRVSNLLACLISIAAAAYMMYFLFPWFLPYLKKFFYSVSEFINYLLHRQWEAAFNHLVQLLFSVDPYYALLGLPDAFFRYRTDILLIAVISVFSEWFYLFDIKTHIRSLADDSNEIDSRVFLNSINLRMG